MPSGLSSEGSGQEAIPGRGKGCELEAQGEVSKMDLNSWAGGWTEGWGGGRTPAGPAARRRRVAWAPRAREALEGSKHGSKSPTSPMFQGGLSWQERSVRRYAGRFPMVLGGEAPPGVGGRGKVVAQAGLSGSKG